MDDFQLEVSSPSLLKASSLYKNSSQTDKGFRFEVLFLKYVPK